LYQNKITGQFRGGKLQLITLNWCVCITDKKPIRQLHEWEF